jgi:hypothetical protein
VQARESAELLGELKKTALAPLHKPERQSGAVGEPTDTQGLSFQPDATLPVQMNWVCDNVSKMSWFRILGEGAMVLCDQLIAMHYREEE